MTERTLIMLLLAGFQASVGEVEWLDESDIARRLRDLRADPAAGRLPRDPGQVRLAPLCDLASVLPCPSFDPRRTAWPGCGTRASPTPSCRCWPRA